MDDDDLNDYCDENCMGCFDEDDENATCNEDCAEKCDQLVECMIDFMPCYKECGTEDNPLYCHMKCSGCADGECPEDCHTECKLCAECDLPAIE